MKLYKQAVLSAALLGLIAAPSLAQVTTNGGLITVNLSDITIQNIANNLHVDVSQIPVTVQVPIGIAANVCGIEANVLAAGGQGTACTADSTSRAFDNLVQRNLVQ